MKENTKSDNALRIRIRSGDSNITLSELKAISARLQQTLAAVAKHVIGESQEAGIAYEIVAAEVGSLSLNFRAVSSDSQVAPITVFDVFTEDLARIREQSYRPGLTPGLVTSYLSLVRTLGQSESVVEYAFRDRKVEVNRAFRASFEVALRETTAEDVAVAGTLEAVNTHKATFAFYLYPKIEGTGRIECRFPNEMLSAIADMLKGRPVVQVSGRGHFLPIGVYPVRIDVTDAPRALDYAPDRLRSYVRKFELVARGVSASEYLADRRKEAGFDV